MHVVVAGGAGFIGSNLVTRLVNEGVEVTVLDNFCTGRRRNLEAVMVASNLRVIECDVIEGIPDSTNANALMKALWQ